MSAKEKPTAAGALEQLRETEDWESLKDFSFSEYDGHTSKAGNRYSGYGETEWDDLGETDSSWLDAEEDGKGLTGEPTDDLAKKPERVDLPHTSAESVRTRAREVAEHDESSAGLSQDEQAMLSSFSELYKSRDGRMTVFSDAAGHVVCVQTKRLA